MSILKKAITAVSGLALVGFLVTHLAANLLLLSPNPDAFNTYPAKLQSFGWLLILAEIGLGALFVIHAINGVALKLNHRGARPVRYKMWKSKGGASRASLTSLSMAISGSVLLVFLIAHVWTFRFGPGVVEGYVTQLNGAQERDLYRLVLETFRNPAVVAFYLVSVVAVGVHLKHGFWSAFQSLGVSRPKIHRLLNPMAWLIAIVFTLGFGILPVALHLRGGS